MAHATIANEAAQITSPHAAIESVRDLSFASMIHQLGVQVGLGVRVHPLIKNIRSGCLCAGKCKFYS